MLTIVGAHATGHVRYDAPLQSDIEALARHRLGLGARQPAPPVTWPRRRDARRWPRARRGQIATLILPADVSWGDGASA